MKSQRRNANLWVMSSDGSTEPITKKIVNFYWGLLAAKINKPHKSILVVKLRSMFVPKQEGFQCKSFHFRYWEGIPTKLGETVTRFLNTLDGNVI